MVRPPLVPVSTSPGPLAAGARELDGARPAELVVLIAIMLSAAVLRLAHLTDRGYIYWDEGKFALEGARMHDALRDLFGAGVSLGAEKAVGTAKPTHALLIGLADLLLGVHDYSALLLSAGSSTVAVGVTYLIARRLFGGWIAALSALFLAISTYDVIYARSALSESDANLFFLVGVLVWIGGQSPRRRVVAGALLGLAVTTNYRMLVYCGVLLIVAFIQDWRGMGRSRAVRHALAGLLGVLVFPLAWQVVDLAARVGGLVLLRNELTGRPSWYGQQLLHQLHGGKQVAAQFDPGLYLHWYLVREGWQIVLLAVVGLVAAIRCVMTARSAPPGEPLLAALVVFPLAVYSFAPFIVPRNLSTTIPFLAMLASVGLGRVLELAGLGRARRRVLVGAALIIAAVGAAESWQLVGTRSAFVAAATYVQRHAGGRALASNEIMVFYLRGTGPHCGAPRIPNRLPALTATVVEAYPYAALDQYNRPASRFVRQHMRLVARYGQQGVVVRGENLVTAENGGRRDPNDPNDAVSIYRLNAQLIPPGTAASVPSCDRNRV
jgi:4-amino-4-deoxy-L-arabinose transferase-like glycosyltransferase